VVYPYKTTDAALTDVLRLSHGMSYKNAIADLPLGRREGGVSSAIPRPTRRRGGCLLMPMR